MMRLFAPEAVFVAADGTTITDRAQIAAELERTLSRGLPMEAKPRHMFVADNVAQDGAGLVNFWHKSRRQSRPSHRHGERCPAARNGWTLAGPD
jgi:hypothetical protein